VTESERKGFVEFGRGAGTGPVRGLGVGVTGPSLPYELDSTENWDKDGEYSHAGLSLNCKKMYDFLRPRCRGLVGCSSWRILAGKTLS
jgi:hypothetical protein